ncbi:MAG: Glu-tRNA(Gln) amidotransferase subunit GatD [Thermoplasmatales archaeon]|nr:Glu-tRNA(Gln) amidotransferase subunit GatD [Thermoplasmatales archaeon]
MAYSKRLETLLSKAGAEIGCRLSVRRGGARFEGILMGHGDANDPDAIVIKTAGGYNAGIMLGEGDSVEVLSPPAKTQARKKGTGKAKNGSPRVAVVGTGGTIAASVDAASGALGPNRALEDLLDEVPGLRDDFEIVAEQPFAVFSEDMGPSRWTALAEAVVSAAAKDVAGVVVTHGTDTMGHSAAALSFMLRGIGKPIVLTGAQRSPDRPSSDAFGNILSAARYCATGKPGVYVLMRGGLNDDEYALFEGTRAKKMHTSRRDAFRAPNVGPFATMDDAGAIEYLRDALPVAKYEPRTRLEPAVALVKIYPGIGPAELSALVSGKKGIVIEGTGMGHVPSALIGTVADLVSSGVLVGIATQCAGGSVNLNVYGTGRALQAAGAIPLSDTLPETALVKMMWALANCEDPAGAMRTPLAGECSDRRELV